MARMLQPPDLEYRARARFGSIGDAEVKLLRAAYRGETAYCGPSEDGNDPNNNPANSGNWGPDRCIRTELVRWLCLDQDAKEHVDPRGIQVHAACVTGEFDLSYVVVPFPLRFVHCVFCDGELNLKFLEVPSLDLTGTHLPSLNADLATVKGSIFLRRVAAQGAIQLRRANIGASLFCEGAKFQTPGPARVAGTVLDAEGAKVAGGVYLRNNFLAEGIVRLFSIQIGNTLECDGGKFHNPPIKGLEGSGVAIVASYAKVTAGVYLRKYSGNDFEAKGEVRFFHAEIGGNLECDGGKFHNPPIEDNPPIKNLPGSGMALTAEGAKVTGAVLLRERFDADGEVRLYGARIGGNLDCQSGKFGSLDLRNASASAILDSKESWPAPQKLRLDGFTYDRIIDPPITDDATIHTSITAKERLEWLERQPSFTRHPYRQLAKVLREAGDDRGWRQVCAKMEQRTWAKRHWIFRPLSYLLRGTIGYGYFSLRAMWWLAALVILGFIVYWHGYYAHKLVPTGKDAYNDFAACKDWSYYETFHALPYSLENSFPLVKLGIQDKWTPGDVPSSACAPASQSPRFSPIATSGFLRWFRWLQICAGWILTTLFVAGITGIIRKE